jgi:endonuclease III
LKESKYRWGKDGMVTIDKVVKYFRDELEWNFKTYFDQAQKNYMQNFPEDELLKIKNIGNKVRDLALGNFNENYIAVDLHIARVSTRIGLLNFGYTLFPDSTIEMGNSPQNPKHYLFFHKLFLKLSEMTEHEYAPADFCRSIWHFGRAVCSDEAKCGSCPIKKMCLTGMFSGRTKN